MAFIQHFKFRIRSVPHTIGDIESTSINIECEQFTRSALKEMPNMKYVQGVLK
jgi:hypothetical protein